VRWSLPLHDLFSVSFRGDTGGFGASSDLIWGLLGTRSRVMARRARGSRHLSDKDLSPMAEIRSKRGL